jgi:hypothetical protein
VIDDPDTDVGNTTSPINEEIHKGECKSFLERCRKWKRLLRANIFAGKFFSILVGRFLQQTTYNVDK